MAKIPQDGHSDSTSNPGMKGFKGIGTFGPVPATNQKFNHGHSPQADLAHPAAKPPADTTMKHPVGKK